MTYREVRRRWILVSDRHLKLLVNFVYPLKILSNVISFTIPTLDVGRDFGGCLLESSKGK